MTWSPLDMYIVGRILYTYRFGNIDTINTKGIMYFKIIEKKDNKLVLTRLASKFENKYCKIPDLKKNIDSTQYIATVNKRTGEAKVKYEGKSYKLKRWDGEPKYDY